MQIADMQSENILFDASISVYLTNTYSLFYCQFWTALPSLSVMAN